MKSRYFLAAAALAVALSLTACGSKSTDMKGGAAAMRQELAAVQSAVEKGDAAAAQKAAAETDEAWEKFEDAVKAKDKAVYEKAEDALHAITAGTKSAQLDKKLLSEQIVKLDGILNDLSK